MSSNALLANGTLIQRENTPGGGTYTTIPEVGDIEGPTGETQQIDATDQQSTAKEYINDIPDFGTISFEVWYIPTNAQHNGLRDDRDNGTVRAYKIIFPDIGATDWIFSAIVIRFGIISALGNKLRAATNLKLTGSITY